MTCSWVTVDSSLALDSRLAKGPHTSEIGDRSWVSRRRWEPEKQSQKRSIVGQSVLIN